MRKRLYNSNRHADLAQSLDCISGLLSSFDCKIEKLIKGFSSTNSVFLNELSPKLNPK
jgi:hypothetical protein